MENTNEENKILAMLRSPEGEMQIQRIVEECLDAKIKEIMTETGLSEVEVLDRLRGVPAAGA